MAVIKQTYDTAGRGGTIAMARKDALRRIKEYTEYLQGKYDKKNVQNRSTDFRDPEIVGGGQYRVRVTALFEIQS